MAQAQGAPPIQGPMQVMPLLMINMGCEMIYILEQRLGAQRVQSEKAIRVLTDVIRTMFSRSFVGELFKPQMMYTAKATRQIFNKLAHSSIMRLNESSMDKLYDLMTMGFKQQMLCCAAPEQLLEVTRKHMRALSAITRFARNAEAQELLLETTALLDQVHGNMSQGEWWSLKHMLASFFQGRRVKVSLFLSSRMQAMDGTIMLRNAGPLPRGANVPGTIRYFKQSKMVSESSFSTEHGARCSPFNEYKDTAPHALGANLFQKSIVDSLVKSNGGPWATPLECAAVEAKADALPAREGKEAEPPAEAKVQEPEFTPAEAKAHATAELNLLANLMGAAAKETENAAGGGAVGGARAGLPSLNSLFDPNYDTAESKVQSITIDGGRERRLADKMMEDLDLKGDPGSKGGGGAGDELEDPDDLLALMDAAGAK